MKKFIIASACTLMIIACEKNDGKQNNVQNRKPDTLAMPNQEKNLVESKQNKNYCYLSVIAKDSMILKYKVSDGHVSGTLIYKNFEKDSSTGDVSGKVSGDTLKLDYKFVSEGITSHREIFFLQNSGVLLEGIGEYANTNSSFQRYVSGKLINFSKGRRLAPTDCTIGSR